MVDRLLPSRKFVKARIVKAKRRRKLLKKRLGEVTGGRFVADEERVSFDELIKELRNDYQANCKRSLKTVEYYLPHMRKFFGMERAIDSRPIEYVLTNVTGLPRRI